MNFDIEKPAITIIPYLNGFLRIQDERLTYFTPNDQVGTPIALTNNVSNTLKSTVETHMHEGCTFKNSYYIINHSYVILSYDLTTQKIVHNSNDSNFIGIAATDTKIVVLDQDGCLFYSADGLIWEQFNFCDHYSQLIRFTKLHAKGNTFYAIGINKESFVPVILFSSDAKVWNIRPITIYDEHLRPSPVTTGLLPMDAIWDGFQYIVLCTNGCILTVPDCPHCSSIHYLGPNHFIQAAFNNTTLACLDLLGNVFLINTNAFQKTNISMSEVHEQLEKSVPLIDVRSAQEYAQKHILGSINIPLAILKEELKKFFPNLATNMIFYCGTGMRAARALDIAISIGYSNVKNMGSMNKWTGEYHSLQKK